MGASTIKAFFFSVLLAVFEIPFDLLGKVLVANSYTTAERWASISYTVMAALCAVIYAKIVNTQFVKDLSGVISTEDSDRIARVARAAKPDTPLSQIKTDAADLKTARSS